MKLFTGKAEQDFEDNLVKLIKPEQYYAVNYTIKQDGEKVYEPAMLIGKDLTEKQIIEWFCSNDFSMQSGVYMEWLRSVGIEIEIEKWIELHRERDDERTNFYYWIIYVDNVYTGYESKEENIIDYNTAQTEAIKQAGKIYNERGSK